MANDPSKQTKRERKEALRAEREAAAKAQAARKQRTTRLLQLGGVVAAALVVVLVLVLVSSGSKEEETAAPQGERFGQLTKEMLTGIPQDGEALGDPKAPVTLVEFADLQCPFCKDYAEDVLPPLIEEYVRTKKVRMEIKLLSFLGPDSVTGARMAYAAADQDRMWDFTDLFYENQGDEGSGYVDDAFLERIGGGIRKPFDFAKAKSAAESKQPALDKASSEASDAGFSSTPSFLIGPTGGKLEKLEFSELSPDAFKAEIDKALSAATR